jgi:hypothetical protein
MDALNKAKNTLLPTLPHKIVANKKWASFLNPRIRAASLFPASDWTSSLSRLNPKNPKLSPENMAD